MAGNSSVSSDRQGCKKTMDEGTVANQLGSWPYGRAGWCPGQQTDLWMHDITRWVNPTGANDLLYQGLWNGQQYTETSSNPNIRANIMIVYYQNISNIIPSIDSSATPAGSNCSGQPADKPTTSIPLELMARDERMEKVED